MADQDHDAGTASEPQLVTEDMFATVDLDGEMAATKSCDHYEIAKSFRTAARKAAEAQEVERAAVLDLMHAVFAMAVKPEADGDTWVPMWTSGGRRTSLPQDFIGDQSSVFKAVATSVKHPALRARLADIVWTNDRSAGTAGRLAVEAYCEIAMGLTAGQYVATYEDEGRASLEAVEAFQRALQITSYVGRKGDVGELIQKTFDVLYDQAINERALVPLARLGSMALGNKLRDRLSVAQDFEKVAADAPAGSYAMSVHRLLKLAASIYQREKDEPGRQRALRAAVDQTLTMRKSVGSAAAEAHWVTTALQELRHVKDAKDLQAKLEGELAELQSASTNEMGSFSIELDVGQDREAVAAHFAGLGLSDALLSFAKLEQSREVDELRDEARDTIKTAPLMAMMPVSIIDDQGRTVSIVPGASGGEEPSEAWFRKMIDQSERFRRAGAIAGRIDPARQIVMARFSITEKDFEPIVTASPFVPQGHEAIMAIGFARLFQGDAISAAHLLIPQIEGGLRQVLRMRGHKTSIRRDDGTEQDRSISELFNAMGDQLDEIFGVALSSEINLLFAARPGPALRHEMAHGKISSGACYHPDVYYATWLIYRICCLFIMSSWNELVAPAMSRLSADVRKF